MSRATRMGSNSTLRCEIDEAIIEEALEFASTAKDSKKVRDYVDTEQRYLVLRQRGSRVSWFVRAKARMKRIGNAKKEPGDPSFLDLRHARQKAGELYYTMKPGNPLQLSTGSSWTWADLDREYRLHLGERRQVGQRIKPPSKATANDVRLCFGKGEFAAWQKLKLAELTPLHLIKLLDDVHAARGRRSAEKASAYVKAALNWALSQRTIKSGLAGTMPWWAPIAPPEATEDEIDETEIRQKKLLAAKDACTVDYLGEVLAKHEQYCAGRQGNKRISPSIRWAMWWVALFASRRMTTTKLKQDQLKHEDPRNPCASPGEPWGIAEWPAEAVKNKTPFMLPVPPLGLHIANSCMWDFKLLLAKKRGFQSRTQWVFASSRRPRPKGENSAIEDRSIYPNSLNAHIRALRGRKKTASNKIDYLGGDAAAGKDAEFWPHLVRSALTNYFAEHRGTLPPGAVSAMLGHTLPDDGELDWMRISKTTERYYLTYQHMDLKAPAMKAWSEALLQAYVKAGGTLPMPYEKDPCKKNGPDWILPQLPGEEPSPPRRRAGEFSRRGSQREASKRNARGTRRRAAA